MTFKSFTDNAKSFTFKHEFETMDHANVTSTAILVIWSEHMNNNQQRSQSVGTRLTTPLQWLLSMWKIKTLQRCLTVFVIALRAILRVAVKHS